VSVKIRVLHVLSGDLWAGAEVMVSNLLEQLGEDAAIESIAVGLNDGVLIRRLADRGIETHLLAETEAGFTRLALDCARRLRGRRIDVVHTHRYKENLLATVVAHLLGVKRKVVTMHGASEAGPRPSLRSRVITAIDRFNVRTNFDAVVAVSAQLKTLLLELGMRPERVRLIRNGIKVPRHAETRRGNGSHHLHIGTVGRLVPVKGYRLFLELAARLHARHSNVRFSILGDGPMLDELTREAARLGLGEHVSFVPARPDPQPYYRELDIYVNTSLHEGLPLSVLEAMACGTPVIAPRVGGIPEVVCHEEHGFLVEGRAVSSFAAYCERLIEDRELRWTMGQAARARVTDAFDRAQMAAGYRTLYEELCAR
jgi:glycosyltransferase involved in cell wall biosynthesis